MKTVIYTPGNNAPIVCYSETKAGVGVRISTAVALELANQWKGEHPSRTIIHEPQRILFIETVNDNLRTEEWVGNKSGVYYLHTFPFIIEYEQFPLELSMPTAIGEIAKELSNGKPSVATIRSIVARTGTPIIR